MDNTKSLVVVITSLMFLVSGTICSQLFVQPVLAAPMHPCFDGGCPGYRHCTNDPGALKATCCWKEPGVIPSEINCQTCDINTDTGEFDNCSSASKGTTGPGIVAPPPLDVAPPPPTESCPENTARDAQGNCSPMTQGPQETKPGPEEIAPTIDCNENPDDPLCETVRIPEAGDEGSNGGGEGEDDTEDSSSDGGDTNPNEG